jgi:hypothetical protein
VAECARLESVCRATYRGFKSLILRQKVGNSSKIMAVKIRVQNCMILAQAKKGAKKFIPQICREELGKKQRTHRDVFWPGNLDLLFF